jgi:hypothetical protein
MNLEVLLGNMNIFGIQTLHRFQKMMFYGNSARNRPGIVNFVNHGKSRTGIGMDSMEMGESPRNGAQRLANGPNHHRVQLV